MKQNLGDEIFCNPMIINTKGELKKSDIPRISYLSHQLPLSLATPRISHPSTKFFYNVIETLSAASRCNPSVLSYRQELHQTGIYSGSEKTSKIFNIDCVYRSLRYIPYYIRGKNCIYCKIQIFLKTNYTSGYSYLINGSFLLLFNVFCNTFYLFIHTAVY